MCYAGGPYCAKVAYSKVSRAREEYETNPSYNNFQSLRAAESDYHGTKNGQKDLEKEILNTSDPYKRNDLLLKKEQSAARRKKEVTAAVSRDNMKKAQDRYMTFVKGERFQKTKQKLDQNLPLNADDISAHNEYHNLKNEFEESRQDVIKTNQGIDRKKDVTERNDVPVYNSAGYDQHGYDKNGFDEEGYDKEGYDKWGWDKDKFDREGYDQEGWDGFGFSRHGLHKDVYGEEEPHSS